MIRGRSSDEAQSLHQAGQRRGRASPARAEFERLARSAQNHPRVVRVILARRRLLGEGEGESRDMNKLQSESWSKMSLDELKQALTDSRLSLEDYYALCEKRGIAHL